ncbi:MAG: hypothetical protein U0359_06620 [Byssovorax sp.]
MSGSSSGDAAPRDGADAMGFGVSALALLSPIALLAWLAVLFGRALGPSIAGTWVGADRAIFLVQYTGSLASQLCGMAAIVLCLAELLMIKNSRLSMPARVAAMIAGGAVILGCFFASSRAEGLALPARAVVGVSASIAALIGAWSALRAPLSRAPGLVVGLTAVASLLRMGGALAAYIAADPRHGGLASTARGLGTVAALIGALALLVALGWLASRARGGQSPLTLAALIGALVLAREGVRSLRDEAAPATVLAGRALDHLVPKPVSSLPASIQLFIAALAVLLALAALVPQRVPLREGADPSAPRARLPTYLGATIALALLVRDTPEMPLGGVLLVVAGLGAALGAEDDRGLWAAIGGGPGHHAGDTERRA